MKKYEVVYKLQEWIDIDYLHWDILSRNPNAIYILEKNLEKIDWISLCKNPNPNEENNMRQIANITTVTRARVR
jgi:hypothetical protein